jgi:hypothetical protein
MGAFQTNLCEQFFMLEDTLPIHDIGYRNLNERFSKHAQVTKIVESRKSSPLSTGPGMLRNAVYICINI